MHSFVWYRYWPVLTLLVGLRLGFWLGAFPNPDEAYYWLWGQHLDWSYFDHPPLHAWVQGLFSAVLGRSLFVLRLPNFISTGIVFWFFWLICKGLYRLQRKHAFWLTVLLTLASPLFFLFMAMAWHDHWLICFGIAASYCLVRFLSQEHLTHYPWLYGTGILIGCAGLCKYVALFLGLGFLVGIASHRQWRSLFWNGHLYGALGVAFLVMTPVFWWNFHHEFYSFQFYLGRSVQAAPASIQWFGPIGFVALSGVIFGPFHLWMAAQAVLQRFPTRFGAAYLRIAVAVLATSTLCLAVLAFRVPVLYYWNILAYPLLFPLMAGIFLRAYPATRLRQPRLLTAALALGGVAALSLVVHYAVLPLSAPLPETVDPDTRMVYGWQQVAERVQAQRQDTPATALLTTDYRSASALAYALGDPSVMAISGRIDQFDFWYDPAVLAGQDALLLGDRWHPICPTHLAMFQSTAPLGRIPAEKFGIRIKEYRLIRGQGFDPGSPAANPLSPDYPLAFTSDGERCKP